MTTRTLKIGGIKLEDAKKLIDSLMSENDGEIAVILNGNVVTSFEVGQFVFADNGMIFVEKAPKPAPTRLPSDGQPVPGATPQK